MLLVEFRRKTDGAILGWPVWGFAAAAVAVLVLIGGGVLIALNLTPAYQEVALEGGGTLIVVPPGGDLQAAINRARGGDVIQIAAGSTYGPVVLPKKSGTEFVAIVSSAVVQLPADRRVAPSQAGSMARIVTRNSDPALSAADGARFYRMAGIEFVPQTKDFVYNLVSLTASTSNPADIPSDIEFDRCLFRSVEGNITRRGLALNSANTVVKNSHFEGFAYPQQETQGICGWTGTRNVKIINNYIEGGAENIMFGGSDPANAELIPRDIEISGNHLNKPAAWKSKGFSMKCLFELKNAKRVVFSGNLLENNWVGSAFRITVRNQDGKAPFSTIEDVTISRNFIRGSGDGINILGRDDTHPSATLRNLTISGNLFTDLGAEGFEGAGYFLQASEGDSITVSNNTALNRGNIVTFHGTLPRGFLFRDNIVGHGEYGIHGFPNVRSAAAGRTFFGNVVVNNRGVGTSDTAFPPGNVFLPDFGAVGFADFKRGDFTLLPSSRYRGKGADFAAVPRFQK